MAACEAPLVLNIGGYHYGHGAGLPYGQNVHFFANDWHAGLVPGTCWVCPSGSDVPRRPLVALTPCSICYSIGTLFLPEQ